MCDIGVVDIRDIMTRTLRTRKRAHTKLVKSRSQKSLMTLSSRSNAGIMRSRRTDKKVAMFHLGLIPWRYPKLSGFRFSPLTGATARHKVSSRDSRA